MKSLKWISAAAMLLIGGVLLGRWSGPRRTHAPVAAGATRVMAARQATAAVKTIRLGTGVLWASLEAYGTVVARASAIRNVAVPFECQVLRVLVSRGQKVLRGEALVQVVASPREILQLAEAQRQALASSQQLAEVNARIQLRLATRQDLLLAQQAESLADLRLANLEARGIGGKRMIRTGRSGIVAHIPAEPGQIVPAGGPLLQIVSSQDIEVRLGVEPEDVIHLAAGRHVRLFPVGESRKTGLQGTIRLVTREVDPVTRLVNVFVSPPPDSGLLLGQFIRARIVVASRKGLLVPRSSVLPDGNREVLYTVQNGRAKRHLVTIDLATDHALEISGPGLKAGDSIVVRGNAELTDGMAVTGKFAP